MSQIHINKLYENFNSMYNTSQFGFFRPVTDFVPAVHEVSLDIFNRLVPLATKSQKAQDWLSPFLKTVNVSIESKPTFQMAPFPKDYEGYQAARILIEKDTTKGEQKCDLVKKDECIPFDDLDEEFFAHYGEYTEFTVNLVSTNKWSAALNHRTKGPTISRPYMRQFENGFIIAPKGIGVMVLDYYRKPKEPVFNYKTITNEPDVFLEFVEDGSVHLEWSETLIPVFLYRLGKRYGLKVHDELILQVQKIDKLFE